MYYGAQTEPDVLFCQCVVQLSYSTYSMLHILCWSKQLGVDRYAVDGFDLPMYTYRPVLAPVCR